MLWTHTLWTVLQTAPKAAWKWNQVHWYDCQVTIVIKKTRSLIFHGVLLRINFEYGNSILRQDRGKRKVAPLFGIKTTVKQIMNLISDVSITEKSPMGQKLNSARAARYIKNRNIIKKLSAIITKTAYRPRTTSKSTYERSKTAMVVVSFL